MTAEFADSFEGCVDIVGGLNVDGDVIGAGFGEIVYKGIGVIEHEMGVEVEL